MSLFLQLGVITKLLRESSVSCVAGVSRACFEGTSVSIETWATNWAVIFDCVNFEVTAIRRVLSLHAAGVKYQTSDSTKFRN